MRNLIAILLVALVATFSFGQDRVIVKSLGTVANAVDETGYVDLSGWSKIDSISVTFAATGELNVDSLTIYRAAKVSGGKFIKDVTVLGNFTVSLDLAAGVSDIEPLFSSNATLLTGAALRGCNALYYLTRGDADGGNDATDPNAGWIVFQIWGTKQCVNVRGEVIHTSPNTWLK